MVFDLAGSDDGRSLSFIRGQWALAASGIGFIYGSVAAFAFVCFRLSRMVYPKDAVLIDYVPELIITGIGVFGSVLGISLLRAVGLASIEPNRVINGWEWDTVKDSVKDGKEDPISQYIRLTSLTGFTGTFTKLGLTALPLATIALTLFFSVLAISYPPFMDLAKLTLGAFIGSFVQKQVGSAQGSVTLPGGEKLAVQSTEPWRS